MKLIPLTQGKFAMVDDEDFEWFNQWKWYTTKGRNTYYAKRSIHISGSGKRRKRTQVKMHRLILGLTDPKILVDHIDGNGLNNHRKNIRKATFSQNNANRNKNNYATSKYLGVSFRKATNRMINDVWVASMRTNKKSVHIGYFKTEKEAAIAYNKAAIKIHGEFASLNQI